MASKVSRLKDLEKTLDRCSSWSSLRSGGPSSDSLAKVALSPSSSGFFTSEKTMCSLERLDERLSHRIAKVENHIEKGLQAILKPLEAKIGSVEKQQSSFEWHLTDLNGTVKAFSDELHVQARQCNFLESGLQRLNEQQSCLRKASKGSPLSGQYAFLDSLGVTRGHCSQQTSAAMQDEMESLRAMADEVSPDELDGATSLTGEELRKELDGRAFALSEQTANDIQRQLKSLRDEMRQMKMVNSLGSTQSQSDIGRQLSKVRENLQQSLTDQLRQDLLRLDLVGGVSKIVDSIRDIDEKVCQTQHETLLISDLVHNLGARMDLLEGVTPDMSEAVGRLTSVVEQKPSCAGIVRDRID